MLSPLLILWERSACESKWLIKSKFIFSCESSPRFRENRGPYIMAVWKTVARWRDVIPKSSVLHRKNDLTLLFARGVIFSGCRNLFYSKQRQNIFLNHLHAHKKMSRGLALLNLAIVPAKRSGWSTVWSHLLRFWRPWTRLLTGHSKRRTCQEGVEVTVEWRITHVPSTQMARTSALFFAFFTIIVWLTGESVSISTQTVWGSWWTGYKAHALIFSGASWTHLVQLYIAFYSSSPRWSQPGVVWAMINIYWSQLTCCIHVSRWSWEAVGCSSCSVSNLSKVSHSFD